MTDTTVSRSWFLVDRRGLEWGPFSDEDRAEFDSTARVPYVWKLAEADWVETR